ncbi:hypothetical protein NL64_27070 [Pseudomonas fluorescens]|nr:hypothetical protein NL64_27070 [Pseudomonas fluorescens]
MDIGGALLFHLLSKQYEYASVVFTTNFSFPGGGYQSRFERREILQDNVDFFISRCIPDIVSNIEL